MIIQVEGLKGFKYIYDDQQGLNIHIGGKKKKKQLKKSGNHND